MKKHFNLCTVWLLLMPVVSGMAKPQAQSSPGNKPASPAAQTQAQAPPTNPKPSETPTTSQTPTATAAVPTKGQTQAPPPATQAGGAAPRATKKDSPDPGYVIGDQDVLVIDVWQEKEFSTKAQVRPDGKITLPLLNDIQAAGLTPTDLATSIKTMLAKYITDPRVTVIVEQINSRVVYLSGNINRPGALPLTRNMTVLQALTLSGGPSQFGNPRKIYIMRTVNGKVVKFPFDYKKAIKEGPGKENISLQPGDTIIVP